MANIPQLLGYGSPRPLVDGATINVQCQDAGGNFYSVTLGGSRNLNFVNPLAGQLFLFEVTQDGTGSRTLTVQVNGVTNVLTSGTPLSTAAGSVDLVAFIYNDTKGKMYYFSESKAFA